MDPLDCKFSSEPHRILMRIENTQCWAGERAIRNRWLHRHPTSPSFVTAILIDLHTIQNQALVPGLSAQNGCCLLHNP